MPSFLSWLSNWGYVADRGCGVKIRIVLRGCDDSTYMDMEVTEAEVEFLERLAKISTETSTYGCMPTLSTEPVPDEAPHE
jgi:hypothetical protein